MILTPLMENNNLSEEDYIYLIALQSVFGVGNITAKTLISYCGSPKNVMTSKPQKLIKIPGIGQKTIEAFKEKGLIEAAEKEYQKTNNKENFNGYFIKFL